MEYREKFIGYVDVLGFKDLVRDSERGIGISLSDLKEVLKALGSTDDVLQIREHGPKICPKSSYVNRDLDFKLTQVSDCVIISSEISPAGVINLISHCWSATLKLLQKGIMCRGYITKGNIYHVERNFFGSGANDAISQEKNVRAFKRNADERGTPYVEIDTTVCKFIEDCGNKCVKKMFLRCVKDDGIVKALFPFRALSHSFLIAGFGIKIDPQRERESNNNIRFLIRRVKDRLMKYVDKSKPDAVRKLEHYIKALDKQLSVCDKTDGIINIFG